MKSVLNNPNADADSYVNAVRDHFRFVHDLSVLEIGPFHGWHTKIIQDFQPRSLTLVEPNPGAAAHLLRHFDHEIVCKDIHYFLQQPRHFDVVVCCGVLYHLHSPMHLLELIVNQATPNIIIIETVHADQLSWGPEQDNIPGARQVNVAWRSARCKIVLPWDLLTQVMQDLGYSLHEHSKQQHANLVSKENVHIGVFVANTQPKGKQ